MDNDAVFISVDEWASFAIHPLGRDIEIGFADPEDRRYILKLEPEALGAIFALIPQMLGLALERLAGNDAAQQVFGLVGWKIDHVGSGTASVLTLSGANGFKVSFLADGGAVKKLTKDLQRVPGQAARKSTGAPKH